MEPTQDQPVVPATAPPEVTRFRPRLAVEAVQLTPGRDWDAITTWSGLPEARGGHWVVHGPLVPGGGKRFWTLGPDEFAATYEPALELDAAGVEAWEAMNGRPARDLPGLRALMDGGEPAPPLPPGIYGRVELPGFRGHVGWMTEGTLAGQPVMVMSGRDGSVLGEYVLGPASRFVRLPVPDATAAEPREAIAAGPWDDYDDDESSDPF